MATQLRRKKRRRLSGWALGFVFASVIGILVGGTYYLLQQPTVSNSLSNAFSSIFDSAPSQDPSSVQFVVSSGETTASIADRLERQRLISSAFTFGLMVRLRGVDQKLEAGTYTLRRNMAPSQVIDTLMQGSGPGQQITFPEGWRAGEMASLLESKSVMSANAFLQEAMSSTLQYDFLSSRAPGGSLEGYLFPDTYKASPGISARELTDKMVQNFGKKFTPDMRQQAAKLGYTINEVVVLASIVEREAALQAERPLIAGVFINRLKKGMPLQADPTVQYAKAQATAASARPIDYWPRALSLQDLQIDSPYNTYQRRGLPPGAICNPGLAALQAVLYSSTTEYLFFVAKQDGSHVFAVTLEEHNRNVAKYQPGG